MKAFESDVAKDNYVLPLQQWNHTWTRKLNENGVWNFVRSLSYINRLSPDKKAVMKQHVEEYMAEAEREGKIPRDENGLIEVPSTTDVRWIKRK